MNPHRGDRCWRGMLVARIAVVPLLLISAYVCAQAAPEGQVVGGESVRLQRTQHKPAPLRDGYAPLTAAEMSPMPSRYLAELATIQEPPEMANRPMQVRRPVPAVYGRVLAAMNEVRSPDKATPAQLETALNKLIALTSDKTTGQFTGMIYGAIAEVACFAGETRNTVINYATKAIDENHGSNSHPMLALRARMYLAEGNKSNALDDLQKLMASNSGRALLLDGEVAPQKKVVACGWSIPSMDALAGDPRGFAAKGQYLSSFLAYGYGNKDAKLEAEIRGLYSRSAQSWHSPIPYSLTAVTLDGLGGEEVTTSAGCVRSVPPLGESAACTSYDHDVMRDIRELTMALLIDPNFGPARAARAEKYLDFAQILASDDKPSLKYFKLAISDFTAAITVPGGDKGPLYNDRGIALASIGEYAQSAASYVEGMKLEKHGMEAYASVYQQLASVYMKMGRFVEAAQTLTDGIMNSRTGLQDVVILGGLKAFRELYPQYDLIPDKIVAEDVRRRYEPQLPESWDSTFIASTAKVSSSTLSDLYALRGDAYMKAGQRGAALEDYARLKSGAWEGGPLQNYFNANGGRDYSAPMPWPSPPPVR